MVPIKMLPSVRKLREELVFPRGAFVLSNSALGVFSAETRPEFSMDVPTIEAAR